MCIYIYIYIYIYRKNGYWAPRAIRSIPATGASGASGATGASGASGHGELPLGPGPLFGLIPCPDRFPARARATFRPDPLPRPTAWPQDRLRPST